MPHPFRFVLVASLLIASTAHALEWKKLLPFSGAGEPCPMDSERRATALTIHRDPPVVAPKKVAWQNALGGAEAAQPSIQARLVGWPTSVLVDRATLPSEDAPFLARLARDTWRGLDQLTDREHALPIDNVRIGDSVAIADCHVADYSNITNVGLHLVAVVAARELGFLDADAARQRLEASLKTLAQLEKYEGYFYNYYDTTSLERTSNFISFVDSAWLTAGLMVARSAFPDLHEPCSALIDRMNFDFLYDSDKGQMSHGYYTNRAVRSPYHYGVLYTEARLGALIAIGKGDVPRDSWFGMVRTFPASCKGQTLAPRDSRLEKIDGCEVWTGLYEWEGSRYVPSWGGSMFEALMPVLVLDEKALAPRSLGRNDEVHSQVQQRYATATLGYPVWGLSPSTTPDGTDYGEYGARVLGSAGYQAGVVTPHAAALALATMPREAAANLRKLASLYDIYGDYGFYDAVDPTTGRVARKYLALDQSMLFIALANHLTGGAVQRYFTADPITQNALPVLRQESFFD